MSSHGRQATLDDEAPGPESDGGLHGLVSRAPLHAGDRAPGWALHAQDWLFRALSPEFRIQVGVAVIAIAVAAVLVLSSVRIFVRVFELLDILAYLGLFVVNWLGNGGALIPIPGARFLGLLTIFSQAAILASWEVFLVSGAAMGLGLLSYYILGARAQAAYATGDLAAASRLAREAGLVDEQGDATAPPAADAEGAAPGTIAAGGGQPAGRWQRRFSSSLAAAQARARPVIEKRGTWGMFLLTFPPTPLGPAAAFVGGALRFGFLRYLAASFGAKLLLAAIVTLAGLVFSEQARAVQLPF